MNKKNLKQKKEKNKSQFEKIIMGDEYRKPLIISLINGILGLSIIFLFFLMYIMLVMVSAGLVDVNKIILFYEEMMNLLNFIVDLINLLLIVGVVLIGFTLSYLIKNWKND